jgi:hypothetical protein
MASRTAFGPCVAARRTVRRTDRPTGPGLGACYDDDDNDDDGDDGDDNLDSIQPSPQSRLSALV